MEDIASVLKLLNDNSAAVQAVSAVAVAFLTYFLASDNRRLRRATTDPEVVVYLAPHPDGHGGVNFVLANVGQGPALDVNFDIRCDESDFEHHSVMLRNSTERTPLTVLPPGERIGSLFGVGYVLFSNQRDGDGVPLRPFQVSLSYKDIRGRRYGSSHSIDIRQFAGLSGLLAKPPQIKIAESLSKIEKHLGRLARNSIQESALVSTTLISSEYETVAKGENGEVEEKG